MPTKRTPQNARTNRSRKLLFTLQYARANRTDLPSRRPQLRRLGCVPHWRRSTARVTLRHRRRATKGDALNNAVVPRQGLRDERADVHSTVKPIHSTGDIALVRAGRRRARRVNNRASRLEAHWAHLVDARHAAPAGPRPRGSHAEAASHGGDAKHKLLATTRVSLNPVSPYLHRSRSRQSLSRVRHRSSMES
jgi:hypothetical protein